MYLNNTHINQEVLNVEKDNRTDIAVIDSATTFVLLHYKLYTKVLVNVTVFCRANGKCGDKTTKVEGEDKRCYRYSEKTFGNLDTFFATFPEISFCLLYTSDAADE